MRILQARRFMFGFIALMLLSFVLSGCGGSNSDLPPPTITSFTPTSGVVGETVTITGTNFSTTAERNTVSFNGKRATVTALTATEITTTVPAGATTGKITVVVDGITATSAADFNVTLPIPTITGFSPESAIEDTPVIITGTNFSSTAANNTVTFNGTDAVVTASTATSINTTVPKGATTGKITVAVAGTASGATSATDFTVTLPTSTDPTITSFTPTSGVVGATVTITGTNFSTTAADNTATFNGTAATVTASTATEITTTVPAGATTGKITVAVGGVTATSAADFTAASWSAASYGFDDPSWLTNTDGILDSTDNPITSARTRFIDMSTAVPSGPRTRIDGLTYFARQLAGNTATANRALWYRLSSTGIGSTINFARSSIPGTTDATSGFITDTGTDLGADAGLNGYVALTIPAGVTSGTIAITFRRSANPATRVAIVGSNATPGFGTTNVVLARSGSTQGTIVDGHELLTSGSISLIGYDHIKVIFSREGADSFLAGPSMDLLNITVGP